MVGSREIWSRSSKPRCPAIQTVRPTRFGAAKCQGSYVSSLRMIASRSMPSSSVRFAARACLLAHEREEAFPRGQRVRSGGEPVHSDAEAVLRPGDEDPVEPCID